MERLSLHDQKSNNYKWIVVKVEKGEGRTIMVALCDLKRSVKSVSWHMWTEEKTYCNDLK